MEPRALTCSFLTLEYICNSTLLYLPRLLFDFYQIYCLNCKATPYLKVFRSLIFALLRSHQLTLNKDMLLMTATANRCGTRLLLGQRPEDTSVFSHLHLIWEKLHFEKLSFFFLRKHQCYTSFNYKLRILQLHRCKINVDSFIFICFL